MLLRTSTAHMMHQVLLAAHAINWTSCVKSAGLMRRMVKGSNKVSRVKAACAAADKYRARIDELISDGSCGVSAAGKALRDIVMWRISC